MELTHMVTVALCAGCKKVVAPNGINVCDTWAAPWAKHRLPGGCPSQTNKVRAIAEKKTVNALKASKRAAAGKATA